jgi:signal transduction histidine kinase
VTVAAEAGRKATVIADRDGLHRVLVNLIDNAIRYARTKVVIALRTEDAGVGSPASMGWAILQVSDDGPGVPANKRERVFDRFYRMDTARSRAEGGTGLGLSIVREIVTAHAGTVTLHDNEPGLQVRIRLPL